MKTIDLNCDVGESFGPWRMGNDTELLQIASSANIACGFHAGDPTTMRKTVELASRHEVAIGAHPGFPDLAGFGRREMSVTPEEVYDLVLYQIAALDGICRANGVAMTHVKPHGALYNQAARDPRLAASVVKAVRALNPALMIYGLSGSCLIAEADSAGMRAVSEVFADRTYQSDGSLTPRSLPNALIENADEAAEQVIRMIETSRVRTSDGSLAELKAQTVCIHGDGLNAVGFAMAIKEILSSRGIRISAPIELNA